MFCIYCGKVLDDEAKFCAHCGSLVKKAEIEEVAAPESKNEAGETHDAAIVDSSVAMESAPAAVPTPSPATFTAPVAPVSTVVPSQTTVNQPTNSGINVNYQQRTVVKKPEMSKPEQYIDTLKRSNSSVLVLIATILFTIGASISVISSLFSGEVYSYIISDFSAFFNNNVIFTFFEHFSFIFVLLSILPTVLVCVGLWINFGCSKSMYNARTTGLNLITAGIRTRLAYKFCFLGLLTIGMLWFIATINDAVPESARAEAAYKSMVSLITIAFVILLISQILPIVYDLFVISTAKTMSETLDYGYGFGVEKLKPMAICNFIFAGINLVSTMFSASFATLFYESATYPVPGISSLLEYSEVFTGVTSIITNFFTTTAIILFGINLLIYRGRVSKISEEE